MKRLVLFGDSLLAQITKSELLLLEEKLSQEYDVYNCATGGWNTDDLVRKSDYIAKLQPDVIVLSVGTNDAAPWKQLELARFKANLKRVLERLEPARVVYFLPPLVNEALRTTSKPFPNAVLKDYYDAAEKICKEKQIDHIDSWKVFQHAVEPEDDFHTRDGIHITEHGYELVFEAIAEVLAR